VLFLARCNRSRQDCSFPGPQNQSSGGLYPGRGQALTSKGVIWDHCRLPVATFAHHHLASTRGVSSHPAPRHIPISLLQVFGGPPDLSPRAGSFFYRQVSMPPRSHLSRRKARFFYRQVSIPPRSHHSRRCRRGAITLGGKRELVDGGDLYSPGFHGQGTDLCMISKRAEPFAQGGPGGAEHLSFGTQDGSRKA
jgi:hypothetical protein